MARNAGASLEHYGLCRCGHSQNKPFCSGMHWYVDFRDPVPDADHEPTMFEWAGGLPALTRMTRLFYEKHVPQDPLLAPLFANMSPDHPERVATWLGEVFGGPTRYSEQLRRLCPHALPAPRQGLTEEKRARWVELLLQLAPEAGLPDDPEFRSAFAAYIEWGSRLAVENSRPAPSPRACRCRTGGSATPPPAHGSPRSRRPTQEAAVDLAADEPVSFAEHIKPLFRPRPPVDELRVRPVVPRGRHPARRRILERLRAGTMPCDGAWPEDRSTCSSAGSSLSAPRNGAAVRLRADVAVARDLAGVALRR